MLFISCNRNINSERVQIIEQFVIDENMICLNSKNASLHNIFELDEFFNISKEVFISYLVWDEHDLLTDHYWSISDGRYIEDRMIQTYDWVGPMTPRAIFKRINIPSKSEIYIEKLRNVRFTLVYQVEKKDKLYQIDNSFSNNVYDIKYNNNFSILKLEKDGYSHGTQTRIGDQIYPNDPLIGIWGRLPNLTEYRPVDPLGCVFYMEIDKEIPFWAVRRGTYLLKQVADNVFETVSSFPDGMLRLEIIDDRQILLRPLFTLPEDEEGLVDLLILNRSPIRISELDEEDPYQ